MDTESNKKVFAERLKKVRTEKGLSQYKLADIMKCARTTISAYELGRNEPSYSDLIKLSKLFNVSAEWLMGNTNDPIILEKKPDTKTNPGVLLLQRAAEEGMPENELEDILSYAKFRFPERFKGLVETDGNDENK